ncbi:MAG TPA: DNA internalization-related competence protein ComEC/Rec2 [Dehalococcoidia bacterium]|nr:DNA internalization-related competence protein ComEC/Rec2 [Dehalococcoidia bacterium]
MTLIYLSCAWVVGIYLGSKFNLPLAFLFTGLIPLSLLLFLRHRRKLIILSSLCLIALFGGAFCYQSSLPIVNENCLQFYNDHGAVEFKGMVNVDPEVRDKSTHLRLSATEIKVDKEWQEVSGTALLFVPRYPTYDYGDMLLVTGELETPSQLDDFDYRGYLAHQGIYSTMLYPKIEILEMGEGFKPLEWIYSLRNRLSQTLSEVLPEPQASLAQGIILGIRGNIPSSTYDAFVHSGTAHMLAISGLHLSIVAGIMISLGIWLFGMRRYIYIWLALSTIWLFALLTGMHAPVTRGAIMASLFLTAELLGRQRSAITSLAFAAAIMVGISPQVLWTASFQLSFLAMAGLIFVFPPIRDLGRKTVNTTLGENRPVTPLAYFITDSFSVALGAIIAVWPLIAHYFSIISFVAPLATFFTLPALPGIIITGALAGSLGLVALPIAQVVAWLAWLFLSYMLMVVNGFAALPISSIEVGSVDTTLIWVYYLALASAIWFNSNRKRLTNLMPETTARLKSGISKSSILISGLPKKWIIPPLLVLAILVSLVAATMPDDNLYISFLNVGQGDAILIQKGNQQVLVDGGPSPQAVSLELSKKLPFWDRTIDLVVLTHPSADHVTGLVEVLQRYKVEQVLYPDLDFKSDIYDKWLRLLNEKNTKCTIAQAGHKIDLGEGVVIEVLNPPEILFTDTSSDIDNNGMVLRLSIGEVSFLLTADIRQEAEFELINRRAGLYSTVLKVAHHGSNTSTCQEFLAVVNPQLAVISVGADNRFGHPTPEVMERLEDKLGSENIYRTDEHGTIEFITNGERLWVSVEKKQ